MKQDWKADYNKNLRVVNSVLYKVKVRNCFVLCFSGNHNICEFKSVVVHFELNYFCSKEYTLTKDTIQKLRINRNLQFFILTKLIFTSLFSCIFYPDINTFTETTAYKRQRSSIKILCGCQQNLAAVRHQSGQ